MVHPATAVAPWTLGHRVFFTPVYELRRAQLATALIDHEIERTAAPYAELPSEPDAYLAARPGQVRSTIKRTAKRFARDGCPPTTYFAGTIAYTISLVKSAFGSSFHSLGGAE